MFNSRKGQYSVIEQVILFGLGIAVLTGFLTTFQNFGEEAKQEAMDRQSRLLAELVRMNIVHLESLGEKSSIRFSLPEKLAGEGYRINLTDDGVAVQVIGTGSNYLKGCAGLEDEYRFNGSVTNIYNKGVLKLENNKIVLGAP
ncbi:MAG: hypothetical protein MUP58_00085 [Candidatus Nanohaloarchaeota archaeon QJJ-9]|nr:hypothetical protein [Candidatus Nanohaloarchaeota archaeon QJJ-9]